MQYKKIMAVGGHVGDMELTAGGLLATCAEEGGEVVTVALTAGERGCPPDRDIQDYRVQKVEEARAFAEAMNGTAYVFDTPDGELVKSDENVMRLARLIRRHRPDLLVTHWKHSMHKDHETCHYITKDAQFFGGLATYELDGVPACWAAGPWYADNWEDPIGFVPYIYTDITAGYERWDAAIQKHWFVTGSKDFPYLRYYRHHKAATGCLIRTDYAEAFSVEELGKRQVIK